MTALVLFPSRVRFVNQDGTLTPEAYRALQEIVSRTGGTLGAVGTDTYGDIVGDTSNSELNVAYTDVVQPVEKSALLEMVTQPTAQEQLLPDVVQPVAAHELDFAKARNGLTMPKESGYGIKVDLANPSFGWRDLIGDINVKGSGASDPSFSTYTGTALRAYQFSATSEKEVFIVYHVPHDYAPGTDIHFHAHWSNAEAAPNTGDVVWGFDYAFAKGFNQEAFPALTSITVTQACPATRYQHNIAETVAVTIAGMEVDGLIIVRGYRKAADAADTCTDAVFLHTMDIHYQSTNMTTKNKAPNFYA